MLTFLDKGSTIARVATQAAGEILAAFCVRNPAQTGEDDMAFSEDIADEVILRISDGESLITITQDPRMPSYETVRRWCATDEAFRARYAQAREDQADSFTHQIQTIADTATAENVQVARLQIDARKWMAGKLRPKVYGDKVAIGGAEDLAPVAVAMTFDVRPAVGAVRVTKS